MRHKTLALKWLFEIFCSASAFVTVNRDVPANPKHFIHVTVSCKRKSRNIIPNMLRILKELRIFVVSKLRGNEHKTYT